MPTTTTTTYNNVCDYSFEIDDLFSAYIDIQAGHNAVDLSNQSANQEKTDTGRVGDDESVQIKEEAGLTLLPVIDQPTLQENTASSPTEVPPPFFAGESQPNSQSTSGNLNVSDDELAGLLRAFIDSNNNNQLAASSTAPNTNSQSSSGTLDFTDDELAELLRAFTDDDSNELLAASLTAPTTNISDDEPAAPAPVNNMPEYQNINGNSATSRHQLAAPFPATTYQVQPTYYQNNIGPTQPLSNGASRPNPIVVEGGVWKFHPHLPQTPSPCFHSVGPNGYWTQAGSMSYRASPVGSDQTFHPYLPHGGRGMYHREPAQAVSHNTTAPQPPPMTNTGVAVQPQPAQQRRRQGAPHKSAPRKTGPAPGHVLANRLGETYDRFRQKGPVINADGSYNCWADKALGSDPAPPLKRRPKGTGRAPRTKAAKAAAAASRS